jgi:hypothetical protein
MRLRQQLKIRKTGFAFGMLKLEDSLGSVVGVEGRVYPVGARNVICVLVVWHGRLASTSTETPINQS